MTATPEEALRERRDVQYELLSQHRAAQSFSSNLPTEAAKLWAEHVAVQRAGYAILDYCTAHAHQHIHLKDIQDLAAHVRAARLQNR
ncbi:hypothetical protein I4J33_06805 [Corynebacterium belfantii]|uniref:hypothetical protein n=1 Tax=Corynebacterium belfantii TaxID=2014537 RepID=UPI0018D2C8DF|nr:hypothetical protein [Corynebacterium belfantii]MBG9326167.1 hypothetical protein [Corynebacterium belfantii]